MHRIFVGIVVTFFVSICRADPACEKLAKKVLENLGDKSHSGARSICKLQPDDKAKSFLVMDRQVYLVEVRSGKILSQGDLDNISDQIESIDTARYWLAPKVRAFGIRSSEYRPHYNAGESLYSLNLYVVESDSIRPVLERLDVGYSASATECNEKDECEESSTGEYHAVVSLAKTRHHGFADLIVSGKVLSYDGVRYIVPDDLLQRQ